MTVSSPGLITISSSGAIVVSGLNGYGFAATVTVTTSRLGYVTETTSVSGNTKSEPPAPNILKFLKAPVLTAEGDSLICESGTFEFIRNSVVSEKARVSITVFTLIVDKQRVSQAIFGSGTISPAIKVEAQRFEANATAEKAIFNVSSRKSYLPAQCEVIVFQENTSGLGLSNTLLKAIPEVSWPALLPMGSDASISVQQLNATANIRGSFEYSVKLGEKLEVGKYTLFATFKPMNSDEYQVVTLKNQLRVVIASTSLRKLVTIEPPSETIQIRIGTGVLVPNPEMIILGNNNAGTPGYGIQKISISGSSITIWPVAGFLGKTSLLLTQAGAGGVVNIIQPIEVISLKKFSVNVKVKKFMAPEVSWQSIPGVTEYKITSFGQNVCASIKNFCKSSIPLGPKSILDIRAYKGKVMNNLISIKPRVVASSIVDTIRFSSGSFKLNQNEVNSLSKLGGQLRKLGYSKLIVEGHADSSTGLNNVELSRARAKEVKLLLQSIIPDAVISTKAKSDRFPIASNKTEAGKAKNRRVEIRVVQG